MRQALHADQKSTAAPCTAGPSFDVSIKLLPAAQVEITYAKISTRRKMQVFRKGGKELLLNVVEYARHGVILIMNGSKKNHAAILTIFDIIRKQ